MAPLTTSMRALAALAALGVASATLTCPTSNPKATSCLCTSNCSINGDAVYFPWSAPSFPVPTVALGEDTICATFVLPCSTAAATLNAFLGITGNIQMDNTAGNDIVGCQANAQVVMHTGFTQAECTNFATAYNALVAATPSAVYPTPVLCTSNACNGQVMLIHSGAGRAAASFAALAALAAAALL